MAFNVKMSEAPNSRLRLLVVAFNVKRNEVPKCRLCLLVAFDCVPEFVKFDIIFAEVAYKFYAFEEFVRDKHTWVIFIFFRYELTCFWDR